MSKSSRRARAAQRAVPAAEDFTQSAADKIGPIAHNAADRLAPLAQTAADRVGPIAEAAADRLGAAADKVSPLAHSAAERLGPLAHTAADRVGPLVYTAADRVGPAAQSAVDRFGPLANQAVDRVSPYAQQAVDRVSPYAHQAADRVSPYVQTAAERIAPIAATAKALGNQVAQDAFDRLSPALDSARERVAPAVDEARERVSEDLLPRLGEALSAAAASPIAVEAAKRGQATLAAAKGELMLPEPKKKSRWFKRLLLLAAVGAVAVVAFRKFFATKDADWQAARPSTPYAPPTPPAPTPPVPAPVDVPEAEVPEAEVPEATFSDESPADVNAEGGEEGAEAFEAYETPAEPAGDHVPTDGGYAEPGDGAEYDRPAEEGGEGATPKAAEPRWSGEGVYVGNEPPEGYVIKGNGRSMKYHVPEGVGYARTVAEVWFNSEEAAQGAGFVRAQR